MSPGERLTLRRARPDDADRLLTWRNDPATRRWFFNPSRVRREDHVAWLTGKLASPDCRIYIAEIGGRPVGQLRLDRSRGGAEVSVSVAREARGYGIATRLLRRAPGAARRDLRVTMLTAHVRPDNVPSTVAFLKAGFTFSGMALRARRPQYRLVLRT
jgi:RimJ/RimL family protein N-acetyltransferase